MLRHLITAGKRALGASIVIGCVLVYAVGGPRSPDADQMIRVAIFGFFVFWVVFAFLFRPARPIDGSTRVHEAAQSSTSWLRGDVHTDDGFHHQGSDVGASDGGDGGGGHAH